MMKLAKLITKMSPSKFRQIIKRVTKSPFLFLVSYSGKPVAGQSIEPNHLTTIFPNSS